MDLRNSQISVASATKYINKARVYGKLDMRTLFTFQLIDYYINFTQETIDNDFLNYIEQNKWLKEYQRAFVYNNSEDLCNYKITTDTSIPNTTNSSTSNTAPTVNGVVVDLVQDEAYTFTVGDFTSGYSDIDGDSYKDLIIYTTGIPGIFTYNGTTITGTIQIPVTSVTNLIYTRVDDSAFSYDLPFKISDNNTNKLFSILTTSFLDGDLIADNQPATIGDNTIYVDNRVTTTLTLEMFTSSLDAPYNDPEGDLIDAIRIDDISSANLGVLQLNNVTVEEGAIITREQLAAGEFTHIGEDQDTISSDVFTFSARDEGSKIWVQ